MKWVLFVLLILLAALLIILLLPVKVRLKYDKTLSVYAGLGTPFIKLYPAAKKGKSKGKKGKISSKPLPDQKTPEAAEKSDIPEMMKGEKLSFDLVKQYLHLINEALGRLRRTIVISRLKARIIIAGSDAAKTALLYGGAAASVSALMPLAEQCFKIKGTDIEINAGFDGRGEVAVDIIFSAMIIKMLAAALKIFMKFRQIQNSSQKTEKEKVA